MAHPIWKDYFVNLGSDATAEYRIRVNSTSGPIIYQGVAHMRPGATSIVVRINDVCADYMLNVVPDMADRAVSDNLGGTHFYVQKHGSGLTWTTVDNMEFSYD